MAPASKYASHVQTKQTPQNQPIPGSTQVQNRAGGFAWQVDCWTRLERFLILGHEGGTYYANERQLTLEAASCINECFAENAKRTIDRIVEVSVQGLAPKNDPAIFALALLSKHPQALEAMPLVCRIGTHLFQYVDAVNKLRGWGPALMKAVAQWYVEKDAEKLAYQVTKYQNREGWTHLDVMRSCHLRRYSPKPIDPAKEAVYKWMFDKSITDTDNAPTILGVYNELHSMADDTYLFGTKLQGASEAKVCKLIQDYRLDRELLPTQWLNSPRVWETMLPHMKLTAMIRNLGKMGAVGLLRPNSDAVAQVCKKLADEEYIKVSRVHPIAFLLAGKVYESGRGIKGSLTWQPCGPVVAALDAAFYKAFKYLKPTGKRYLLGMDVSGSMTCGEVAGTPGVTPAVASAAMAMVWVRSEEMVETMAFAHEFRKLNLNRTQSLNDVMKITSGIPFGGTDCALPMTYATKNKIPVDVFISMTDNETWAGRTLHPSQALQQYRQTMGIPAKMVVMGMTADKFSIADPNDPLSLDVVGFDSSVPQVLAEFTKN